MAANKPKAHFDDEEDEFEVGSDDEGSFGKISVPVAHIQTRSGKDEQSGKFIPEGNLLELNEERILAFFNNFLEIQSIIDNPQAKDELIKRLLESEAQPKPMKKVVPKIIEKSAPPKEITYEGKFDESNPENEADFKKAYAKLINKMTNEPNDAPQMLVTENDLKKVEDEKQKAENLRKFQERIAEHNEKLKKKKDAIKEELEEKAMKECSFAPKTTRKGEKRKLEDFLKDQKKYLDKKQENIAKMQKDSQEKEEQSIASLPRINEKSKVLTENKKEETGAPVHERLYAKSKKPVQIPHEENEEKKPKKKEGPPREFSLYEEAKKRQEKWLERMKKEEEGQKPAKQSKEYSRDLYVQQKYIKEFNSVLSTISGFDPENKILSFEQMSIFINFLFKNRGNIVQNGFYKASIRTNARCPKPKSRRK